MYVKQSLFLLYVVIVILVYNGILFSHEKEGNPVICNKLDGPWRHYSKWDIRTILINKNNGALIHATNLDEPWKHYAKSKKTVTIDQILYNSIYIKCLE